VERVRVRVIEMGIEEDIFKTKGHYLFTDTYVKECTKKTSANAHERADDRDYPRIV
jgi:hypothetical protein